MEKLKLDQGGVFGLDGFIYFANPVGHLLKLERVNNRSQGEVTKDTDLNAGEKVGPAVKNPVAIQPGGLDYAYVFVVDSEKRVLQFKKEGGSFIQQFQSAPTGQEFDNLKDLILDIPNNKLYLVGEQKVFVFKIPPEYIGPLEGVAAPTFTAPPPTPSFRPTPTITP